MITIITSAKAAMPRFVLAVLFLAVTAIPVLAADPQIMISIKDHQFVPSEVPTPAGVGTSLGTN